MRYFDPARKRCGLPPTVAALGEQITSDSIDLMLVNTDPVSPQQVMIQAGNFAEHEFIGAVLDGEEIELSGRHVEIELGTGAAAAQALCPPTDVSIARMELGVIAAASLFIRAIYRMATPLAARHDI